MFPDRVRAVVIDGVLDATAWFGGGNSGDLDQETRMRSAQGAYKALREIMKRCRTAGVKACPLAGGDPMAKFELLAKRLRLPVRQRPGDLARGGLHRRQPPEGCRLVGGAGDQGRPT
ncbi:hypothetical protein GCM10011608_51140 [Micromonospora sonchi]|uniref:Uncharacterized protein n=1 Tax=Micromonospora sonchi TaxID=1763543 RepID=A0A917U5P8_9ACTN|nr:hypothetical protein [Micromonospora sonchi]GGM59802.1 hypothetical protein GCM10011608_51140 [Micromonospora sonchi]